MNTRQEQFLQWEKSTRDTIDFKKMYVDIAGDVVSGLVLSEIVFWHLPNLEGQSKLRVKKHGHWWIARPRHEWWERIRISPSQADRALTLLADKGIIIKELYKWRGVPTVHVHLNWDTFLDLVDEVINHPPTNPHAPKTIDEEAISMEGQNPISPNLEMDFEVVGESLTEITPEKTTKTTNPADAGSGRSLDSRAGTQNHNQVKTLVARPKNQEENGVNQTKRTTKPVPAGDTPLQMFLSEQFGIESWPQFWQDVLKVPMTGKGKSNNSALSAEDLYDQSPTFRVWVSDEFGPWFSDLGKGLGDLCPILRANWDWWVRYEAEQSDAPARKAKKAGTKGNIPGMTDEEAFDISRFNIYPD